MAQLALSLRIQEDSLAELGPKTRLSASFSLGKESNSNCKVVEADISIVCHADRGRHYGFQQTPMFGLCLGVKYLRLRTPMMSTLTVSWLWRNPRPICQGIACQGGAKTSGDSVVASIVKRVGLLPAKRVKYVIDTSVQPKTEKAQCFMIIVILTPVSGHKAVKDGFFASSQDLQEPMRTVDERPEPPVWTVVEKSLNQAQQSLFDQ